MEENSIGTLIEINQKLLQEALDLSEYPTPTELIEAALQEYIQRQRQLKIVELFGTIDYDEAYNYKEQRQIGWRFWLTLQFGH